MRFVRAALVLLAAVFLCGNAPAQITSRTGVSLPSTVAYSSGTTYARGDVVASGGSTYLSLANSNHGNTPSSSPTYWQALGGINALLNDTLLTDTSATASPALYFSTGPSEDLLVHGGTGTLVADALQIPSGNQSIIAFGSMAVDDEFFCASNCSPSSSYPYQNGALPRTFPLGITNTAKIREAMGGANDLSAMASPPNTADQSHYYGAKLAQTLLWAVPDAQKIPANSSTYCSQATGTWTAASGNVPTGTLTNSASGGASIVCGGLSSTNYINATAAGFLIEDTTASTATFTVTGTNAGASFSATDPYTLSTTYSATMPYTSPFGGATSGFFAAMASGLPGGATTVTITCTANCTGFTVVGPVFLSANQNLQNSPAMVQQLSARWAVGYSSSHTDAQFNTLNNITKSVVNLAQQNGLNVAWMDPNAQPNGANQNSVIDMGQVQQITINGSGSSGYTAGAVGVTMSGGNCSIQPTVPSAVVPVSGGGLTSGTYSIAVSGGAQGMPGACTAAPSCTLSGGTGGSCTALFDDDFVHFNAISAPKVAALTVKLFNAAKSVADNFQPGSGGGGGSSSGAVLLNPTGSQTINDAAATSLIVSDAQTGNVGEPVALFLAPSIATHGLPFIAIGTANAAGDSVIVAEKNDGTHPFGYIGMNSETYGVGFCYDGSLSVGQQAGGGATCPNTGSGTINDKGENIYGGNLTFTGPNGNITTAGTVSDDGEVVTGTVVATSSSSDATPALTAYNNITGDVGIVVTGQFDSVISTHAFLHTDLGFEGSTYNAFIFGFKNQGGTGSNNNYGWFGMWGTNAGLCVGYDGSIASGNGVGGDSVECPLTGGGMTVPSGQSYYVGTTSGVTKTCTAYPTVAGGIVTGC